MMGRYCFFEFSKRNLSCNSAQLPEELLIYILSFLEFPIFCRLMLVNKKWHKLINEILISNVVETFINDQLKQLPKNIESKVQEEIRLNPQNAALIIAKKIHYLKCEKNRLLEEEKYINREAFVFLPPKSPMLACMLFLALIVGMSSMMFLSNLHNLALIIDLMADLDEIFESLYNGELKNIYQLSTPHFILLILGLIVITAFNEMFKSEKSRVRDIYRNDPHYPYQSLFDDPRVKQQEIMKQKKIKYDKACGVTIPLSPNKM